VTNFFNNVFDPEKDFPAVTPPAQSELYPVASTMMAREDRASGSALLVDHRWPRGKGRAMEFRGHIYSLPAREFGR
jgi:hypothetical protein